MTNDTPRESPYLEAFKNEMDQWLVRREKAMADWAVIWERSYPKPVAPLEPPEVIPEDLT